MKFGEVYHLRYKGGRDKNPKVIILATTKDKICGINLNLIPMKIQDQIITLFNNEIFKNFYFDEDLVEEAQQRQKEINERQVMMKVIADNRDRFDKSFEETKIKSKTSLFGYMYQTFRVYNKNKIEKFSKIII